MCCVGWEWSGGRRGSGCLRRRRKAEPCAAWAGSGAVDVEALGACAAGARLSRVLRGLGVERRTSRRWAPPRAWSEAARGGGCVLRVLGVERRTSRRRAPRRKRSETARRGWGGWGGRLWRWAGVEARDKAPTLERPAPPLSSYHRGGGSLG